MRTLDSRGAAIIILNDIIPPAGRSPRLTVRRSNGAFLQKSHKLLHRVLNHHFGITFHQNIELGILAQFRLLARQVEVSFRRDGRACRFENLGDIRAVSDGPTSFLCELVSGSYIITRRGQMEDLRGKSLISNVA